MSQSKLHCLKFVVLQIFTTLTLVLFIGFFLSLIPLLKDLSLLMTWIFIYSAIVCGTIPCVLGAVLNQSKFIDISSFKAKSIISWAFSFFSTLIIWVCLGYGGETEEVMGRILLLILPAIFSLVTWVFYAKKFLKV